nr:type IX secretion system sortase PorU [Bacteroidota bacterium]
MKHIIKHTYLFLLLIPLFVFGQDNAINRNIYWTGIQEYPVGDGTIMSLHFNDAQNADNYGLLPVFSEMFELTSPGLVYDFTLIETVAVEFEEQDKLMSIPDINRVSNDFEISAEIVSIRDKNYSRVVLLPIRYNEKTGNYEKITSFKIQLQKYPGEVAGGLKSSGNFAENSVLAVGSWYKIGVSESGIYEISYDQLKEMGLDIDGAIPTNIQLFGNGGGMLPEVNGDSRYDDLLENAIMVADGGDGSFDPGDYILFYGDSPHQMEFNSGKQAFTQVVHKYSDLTCYFLTIGDEPGKRIESVLSNEFPETDTITNFNDFVFHEPEEINLIKSGSQWYGEDFTDQHSYDFQFTFPNIDTSSMVYMVTEVAARSTTTSTFKITVNGDSITSMVLPAIHPQSVVTYANSSQKNKRIGVESEIIDVNLLYSKPADDSKGWLNFIEVNAMRHLIFTSGQMDFRNSHATGEGKIGKFVISGSLENLSIWDVTNPLKPKAVDGNYETEICWFKVATDTLKEFIGFDGTEFLTPQLVGNVENQNLHAFGEYDFIIVTHPDFIDQAERLKKLHEELDQMQVLVVTPQKIYNEFSSGSQDPTAIRDFVKMIYDRSGHPSELKYLLLFGDGSYDPKDRIENNNNLIITYQSKQSLKPTQSYVTDDFFGLMDTHEGSDAYGNVDLGIGRLPVLTPEEAENVIDKIEHYMHMGPEVQGNWRNKLCFIADDEDNNLHFFQADTSLVANIEKLNNCVNINKIYFDAFQQISTYSGHRYPDVTDMINNQVEDGALFINYTGHGGELGWAHEYVIQMNDINSWSNFDKMPVFITATCEFSRYDNPALTSAGEMVLLNPDGGGIALLTTTRLAFALSNLTLNKRIYDTLYRSSPMDYPRLGDLVRFAKTPSNSNIRNFVLLGDPALALAIPKHNVVTDSINGKPAGVQPDTISANSVVTICGHVSDFDGEKSILSEFNGILYPVFYDKPVELFTLGNDPESYPVGFSLQDRILWKGKVSVVNGRFSFSFVVPKDISYQYGFGKISYYAADSVTDAAGYYKNIVVGGYDESIINNTGPEISLFLNDTTYQNGTVINSSPILLVNLADPQGINVTGSGIGHDITAMIDGNTNNLIILNEHFDPDINSYTSGKIIFPIAYLTPGLHQLELKAWDMFNNSSTETIEFIVSDSIDVNLTEVFNYPNPFRNGTSFVFRHNQFGKVLDVGIDIFNFNGQMVQSLIYKNLGSNGYLIEPILWDGKDQRGNRLLPGFYFYRITVENEIGYITERVQKLVISN